MSVEPSPPWITSAPCAAAPRPSASASGALLARMSCSVTMLFAPVSRTNAAPTCFGDAFVKLVRHDAPDVVCLEDLVQIAHCGSLPDPVPADFPRTNLSVGGAGAGVKIRVEPWERSGPRAGGPRRPTSTPWPTGSVTAAWARARGHRLRRGGPGRAGAPCLADDVRQRLKVVGPFLRRVRRQPDHVPAARHDQPGGVHLAQVLAVRFDVGRERPEHGRGVAVHVRERVDGRLLARGT